MKKATYVSRYATVLKQLAQHAQVLSHQYPEQARALSQARHREPELDALFKLEALERLLFAVAYNVNPEAYAPAAIEPVAEESSVEPQPVEKESEPVPAEDAPADESKPKAARRGRSK